MWELHQNETMKVPNIYDDYNSKAQQVTAMCKAHENFKADNLNFSNSQDKINLLDFYAMHHIHEHDFSFDLFMGWGVLTYTFGSIFFLFFVDC